MEYHPDPNHIPSETKTKNTSAYSLRLNFFMSVTIVGFLIYNMRVSSRPRVPSYVIGRDRGEE